MSDTKENQPRLTVVEKVAQLQEADHRGRAALMPDLADCLRVAQQAQLRINELGYRPEARYCRDESRCPPQCPILERYPSWEELHPRSVSNASHGWYEDIPTSSQMQGPKNFGGYFLRRIETFLPILLPMFLVAALFIFAAVV